MSEFKLVRNKIIFLVVILCFLRISAAFEALYMENASKISSSNENLGWSTHQERISGGDEPETKAPQPFEREFATERDSTLFKNENIIKEAKRNFDRVNELFNPFMDFPFFPFHFPNVKRNAFNNNSSEKGMFVEKEAEGGGGGGGGDGGGIPSRKPKPFLFIDLAFNIQETPLRNETRERKSSENSRLATHSKNKRERKGLKGSNRNEDVPFDFLDYDHSFFNDLPLLSRDIDDFLPNSKFPFFDLPFHRKETSKQSRGKRDKSKSEANTLLGIFDQAMSRMKREMEKTAPLWDFIAGTKKTYRKASLPFIDYEILPLHFPESKLNESTRKNLLKIIPEESAVRQGPIIAGKVVKIGEIHIRDDRPKSKKKRRNSSVTGRKEKQGFHENLMKLRHIDEPIQAKPNFGYFPTSMKDAIRKLQEENIRGRSSQEKKATSGRTVRGTQDAKIMDLMAQWDRREMEEQAEGKTTKTDVKLDSYNTKETESGSLISKDNGFKYTGTGKKGSSKGSAGFEVLKPQQSASRKKRQENDGGGIWENVTASKDEVRKNITQILGQFFSMVKKLGESKNSHQQKEHEEIDGIIWPELGQVHPSPGYVKAAAKRMAESERESEKEDKDTSAPVADLNFLFLTVTLPTTLAFTLVLVICFFNLRPTSWLCQKVFQPRNLYVVEDDVERAKPFERKVTVEAETYKRKPLFEEEEEKENEKEDLKPEAEDAAEDKDKIIAKDKKDGEERGE